MSEFVDDLGEWGERVAIDFLKEKGYFVSNHDWRFKHLDIDIVAIDNSTKEIVFVEVKTRRNNLFGEPQSAVDNKKVKNVKRAANAYMAYHRVARSPRFDIIAVTGTDDSNVEIMHFPGAF